MQSALPRYIKQKQEHNKRETKSKPLQKKENKKFSKPNIFLIKSCLISARREGNQTNEDRAKPRLPKPATPETF